MAAVTEREEKTVEIIKDIMPSLGDFDRGYLLGFGQGAQTMRDHAGVKEAAVPAEREEEQAAG